MYAVISLKGHQYIVSEGTQLVVDNLNLKEGENFSIEDVLAVFDEKGETVKLGTPFVKGAKVEATVGTTQKGKKVQVIKFRRKNRYFRNHGFRPTETLLEIKSLIV